MMPFTKLFQSMLHSSIWGEDHATRIVWITMLLMSDADGKVNTSLGGLAHAARVTREEVSRAIRILEDPDPDSRTETDDGRRIAKCDGGWQIVNYRKYRDLGRVGMRRESMAEASRRYREKASAVSVTAPAEPGQEQEEAQVVMPPGFPASEEEAKQQAAFVGVPPDFAVTTYHAAVSRGGRDAKGQPIRSFRSHVKAGWNYNQSAKQERKAGAITQVSNERNSFIMGAGETDYGELAARRAAASK